MPDREKKKLWPTDDEWVPFALPLTEGRCIPEKRMSLKDGELVIESRYPKPSEETDYEDDEPEIEMVPVVRCKDCRWGDWSRNGKDEEMILCYNGDTGIEDGYLHEPDWFCADGERRTDNVD